MDILKYILTFLIAALPLIAEGRIEELDTIAKLKTDYNPDSSTLIIFDIDNTLYHPKQMLGSDEWFDYFLLKQLKEFSDSTAALERALDLWKAIQTVTEVKPLESETPEIIRSLQQENPILMAMTMRRADMASTTLRQLASLNISFAHSAPKITANITAFPDVVYREGVLFTNALPKGEILNDFLKQASYLPERIIYINDKLEPLNEIASALPKEVNYLGLRYTVADRYIADLSSKIVEEELRDFRKIMSDEEAKASIDKCKD